MCQAEFCACARKEFLLEHDICLMEHDLAEASAVLKVCSKSANVPGPCGPDERFGSLGLGLGHQGRRGP